MNLRRLAAKNVWQNRGRYLAFLGSSAFSVMLYFLYTALAMHPYFQGDFRGGDYARDGMMAAAVVIALFTLLFLLYSSAAFVRSRAKEFGLVTLLGLSRGQLIRMLLWENLIVAATAVVVGLGLGLLFLKLFFMAISLLLGLPEELPLYVGWPVWSRTLIVFGVMYLFASLLSVGGVARRNVIELIRAARQPKERPAFSPARAALGFLLVGAGYVWASLPQPAAVVVGVVPVTAMVSVGTYFVMREGSVALLNLLHRRASFFYRPGPFLTVSQLVFKIQENYRVLAAAAILNAVILTAMGTIFSLYVLTEADALRATPQAIELSAASAEELEVRAAQAAAVLQKHGVDDLTPSRWSLPRAELGNRRVYVVPYSFYASAYRRNGTVLPLEDDGEAILVEAVAGQTAALPPRAELRLGDTVQHFALRIDGAGRVYNHYVDALVVTDAVFAALVAAHPEAEYRHIAVWGGPGWRGPGMREAVAELRSLVEGAEGVTLSTALEFYNTLVATFGLTLFIGFFVSLVFFAASCSLLYFRLFTEIEDDRRYYLRLQQLGVGRRDVQRLTRTQAAVVFFIPFLAGLAHSTFAMKALSTLVGRSVLHYGWMVAVGYLVLYIGFFAATYALYWRTLRVDRAEGLLVRA